MRAITVLQRLEVCDEHIDQASVAWIRIIPQQVRIGLQIFQHARFKGLLGATPELGRLREQAFKDGMKPLRISGAMKVGAGVTTIEEVLKVAPPVRDGAA